MPLIFHQVSTTHQEEESSLLQYTKRKKKKTKQLLATPLLPTVGSSLDWRRFSGNGGYGPCLWKPSHKRGATGRGPFCCMPTACTWAWAIASPLSSGAVWHTISWTISCANQHYKLTCWYNNHTMQLLTRFARGIYRTVPCANGVHRMHSPIYCTMLHIRTCCNSNMIILFTW